MNRWACNRAERTWNAQWYNAGVRGHGGHMCGPSESARGISVCAALSPITQPSRTRRQDTFDQSMSKASPNAVRIVVRSIAGTSAATYVADPGHAVGDPDIGCCVSSVCCLCRTSTCATPTIAAAASIARSGPHACTRLPLAILFRARYDGHDGRRGTIQLAQDYSTPAAEARAIASVLLFTPSLSYRLAACVFTVFTDR